MSNQTTDWKIDCSLSKVGSDWRDRWTRVKCHRLSIKHENLHWDRIRLEPDVIPLYSKIKLLNGVWNCWCFQPEANTHWVLVTFVFCWQELSPFREHGLQSLFESNRQTLPFAVYVFGFACALPPGFSVYWGPLSLCEFCSKLMWMKAFYQFKLDGIGLGLWHRWAPTWSTSGSHTSTCQPSRGSDSSASEPGLSSPLESIHPEFEFIPKLFLLLCAWRGYWRQA